MVASRPQDIDENYFNIFYGSNEPAEGSGYPGSDNDGMVFYLKGLRTFSFSNKFEQFDFHYRLQSSIWMFDLV